MRSAAKHVVFFLMVMVPIYRCQVESCVLPLPGKCSTSNYTIDDDEVCPSAKGGCNFGTAGEGLCDYRQGCKESEMTNWTAGNDFVTATQTTYGSCQSEFYYSVLESPWLEFTAVSCLQFEYSKNNPAALDVFLAVHNGNVITILNRTQNGQNAAVTNYTWTVQPGIGKIKFRAYGGGAGTDSGVNVYFVSVSPGDCEISGREATEASDTDTAAPGTTVSSARNCRPLTTAATGTSATSQEDTATQNGLVTSSTSLSSSGNPTLTSPPTTSGADGLVTSTTSLLSSGKPTFTSPPVTSSAGGNSLNNDMADDGPGAATVVGVVIALVAVIAVIVVVVVIWRRRRPKSSTGGHKKGTENEILTLKNGNVGVVGSRKAEGLHGNSCTEIRNSHFALASPSPEGNYIDIDDVNSPTQIETRDADVKPSKMLKVTTRDVDIKAYDLAKTKTRNDADIDPYDLPKGITRDSDSTPYDLAKIITRDDDIDPYDHAEDGAPGKGQNSGEHDHKRFQLHDAPHQKPLPSEKVVDGDYSEIDGPQDITRSDVSDLYSRVRKEDKKPVSPKPKDDYSVVNKKGKKPDVAAKSEQLEGDYNRIRLAGSQSVDSNTPRDAPSDPYNRIGKVLSTDDVGNGGKLTKAEGDQVQDDYNTLNFDEARKMSAKTTERWKTHKAYDRVQTDPYSKAQVGKRNVVIDSDYDHVEK